ncbi:hypothetical protein GCM10023188_16690 [Pontibacter saemangeumensis]|uniref:Uncharacterized protein n=1 Tax=Pontibacter saemangeumensis TaxID=1084525 RepID=A0ABP8LJU6_9BACT
MKITLLRQGRRSLLLLVFAGTLLSCQHTDEKTAASQAETAVAVAGTQPKARPAPEFFLIPPDMAKNRVWICMDESANLFHTKNDCPLLVPCKGTFRNLTLVRAIEDFGRYNCQECSRELDHIFDENKVR